MATQENTSRTLKNFEIELNGFGALLNGVEQICHSEDIGEDGRHLAATVCGQINERICKIADMLGHIADEFEQEGGAA